MEPEPQGAAFFYLEPEPTQFGRSRLQDLGRLEPPKKVAAPQHWARAQRKGGNPARNGRKEGQGSAQRKGGNPARARDLIKRGNLGQEWRTMDRRKETLARI